MPDFDIRMASGIEVHIYGDEPNNRLNPMPGFPPRRFEGKVGVEIVLHVIYEGVEAPPDTALPGVFSSDMGEWPMPAGPPVTVGVTSYSTIQRFTPNVAGHYVWNIRRRFGGCLSVHLDARLPNAV